MIIELKDSLIKQALDEHLECEIYEYWEPEELKASDVPSKSVLIKSLMDNEKFQKDLQASILKNIMDNEVLYEAIWNVRDKASMKVVRDIENRLRDKQEEIHKERRVHDSIEFLKKNGFTIVSSKLVPSTKLKE
jgi:hypothetical protein